MKEIKKFLDDQRNSVGTGEILPSMYMEQVSIALIEGFITKKEYDDRIKNIPFSPLGLTKPKKNPLYKGYSPDIVGRNIAEAVKKGVPHAQAIFIPLNWARREYRAKHPTGPFPRHLKMVGKVRGKNPVKMNSFLKIKKYAKEVLADTNARSIPEHRKPLKRVMNAITRYELFDPHMYDNKTDYQLQSIARAFVHDLASMEAETFSRRKNPVKRKTKKKRMRKNPVSTLIKVFKHGPGEKKFQKVGYFTGTGWDTSAAKAEKYSAGKARQLAAQLKIPQGWGLALVTG